MSQQVQTKQIYLGKYQADDHIVKSTGNGLVCDCDFNGDCKHIKATLEALKKSEFGTGFKIMERSKLNLCPKCGSGDIIKKETRHNKSGDVQRFQCKSCNKKFGENLGFEKMQFDDITITTALNMYHSKMSVRRIADHFALMGIEVTHKTIYNWVAKYGKTTSQYVDGITPHTGKMFRADEVWLRIAGLMRYMFASMDDDTRFWLASEVAPSKYKHNAKNLLRMTKQQAGKNPKHFVTDGLPTYDKASRKVWEQDVAYQAHPLCRQARPRQQQQNGEA